MVPVTKTPYKMQVMLQRISCVKASLVVHWLRTRLAMQGMWV